MPVAGNTDAASGECRMVRDMPLQCLAIPMHAGIGVLQQRTTGHVNMWHERAETMVKLITQADGEVFAAPGDIADPGRGRTRLPTVRRTLRRHRYRRQRRGRHHQGFIG